MGSFGVYFIPLIGPHAMWFVGESLVASLRGDRSLAWMAADISVALTSQIATGVALYLDFFISLTFASPDGIAIVEQIDRRSNQRTWSTLTEPGGPLQRLAESSEKFPNSPILARRGDAVAYVTTVPGSGPPVLSQVLVRKATPESVVTELEIDLSPFGPGSYVLLDVDAEAREVLLWRDERPLIVTFDGHTRPLSFEPGDSRAELDVYPRRRRLGSVGCLPTLTVRTF